MEEDLEELLVGGPAIAAFLARLWRTRARSRRTVNFRTVHRYCHRDGLPWVRFAGGPFMASPSAVTAWWERHFAREIVRSLERRQRVDEKRRARAEPTGDTAESCGHSNPPELLCPHEQPNEEERGGTPPAAAG